MKKNPKRQEYLRAAVENPGAFLRVLADILRNAKKIRNTEEIDVVVFEAEVTEHMADALMLISNYFIKSEPNEKSSGES